METEEGKILQEVVQILNYICDAPAIRRKELARKVMGVGNVFLNTLKDQKLKIVSLEKELNDLREEVKNATESVRHNEATLTDGKAQDSVAYFKPQVDQPQRDPLIRATIVSSVSEDGWTEDTWSEGAFSVSEERWTEDTQSGGAFGAMAENWEIPSDEMVAVKTFKNRSDTKKTKEEADQLKKDSLIGLTIVSSDSEYKVEDLLGEGTFGLVAKCWKKPSNKMVALKIIKDSRHAQEAKVEAQILDSLETLGSEFYNIVSCNHSFTYNGSFCLEFKLLDVSLLDFICGQRFLGLHMIRPILYQMVVALGFMKTVGVVHTDLKPHNIMLVDRHRQPLKIQVIDFGLAIHNPEKWTGAMFQTLWYRAPEVLMGAPFDHSIDMWSLGCIAAEMLRGTPLFYAYDEYDMVELIEDIVGQIPEKVRESGLNTQQFFPPRPSGQQPLGQTSKAPGESSPQISSSECTEAGRSKLFDFVTPPFDIEPGADPDFDWDLSYFIDLVAKMLHLDPSKRITPEEIFSHPFMTMSYFNPQLPNSYLTSSIQCMTACNNQFIDAPRPVSKPFSTSTSETNMSRNDCSGNSEEEPSLEEALIEGAKVSPNERRLEDLDHLESGNSETSIKYKSACNILFIDEGVNIQWPFSNPSTCQTNMPRNDCSGNSEEEPSLQEKTAEAFEEIITFLDSLCGEMTAVRTQQDQLREKVTQVDIENAEKDQRIVDLERQVDQLEQYSWRNNVIISGIKIRTRSYACTVAADSREPDQETLSVEQQVASYLHSKGIEMDLEHIEACHPLPIKNGRPPAVIMMFTNQKWKMALLKQRRKLKGTGVHFSEHLTTKNTDIMRKARQLKKQGKIQKTWVTSCQIFIKLNGSPEEAKVLVVKKMEELDDY